MLLAGSDSPMSPMKAHDLFNLVVTSLLAVGTCAASTVTAWNAPLAMIMCIYLIADSFWLIVRPEIAGGQAGGGAFTLLVHHAAAFVVAFHALSWAPHTPYTCQMTVIEMNTFILMVERQLPAGARVTDVVHKLFVGSWVVTRLLWFPFLAVKLSLLNTYPSLLVQLACAGAMLVLTLQQLVWTWNFCVPAHRQIPLR